MNTNKNKQRRGKNIMLHVIKNTSESTNVSLGKANSSGDAELSCRLARLYLKNGDIHQAELVLRRLLSEEQDNPEVIVECALCYVSAGNVSKAERILKSMLERFPDNASALVAMARLHELKGDVNGQLSFLLAAADAAPKKYEIRISAADLLNRIGDVKGAVKQYKLVIESNPVLEAPLFSLGTLMLRENKVQSAKNCFKRILQNNPTAFDAHFNLGNCYFREKQYKLAIDHFIFAGRSEALLHRALYLLSQCYFKLGDVDRALVNMEKLCDFDPDNIAYKKCLAEFYESTDEYDMAADLYRQLNVLAPERAEFSIGLAKSYIKLSDEIAAEKTLYDMLRKHPGNLEGHKLLGMLFLNRKSYKGAVEEFKRVLMFKPDYPGIYMGLAAVYRETENYVEEQKALSHSVDMGEETPESLLRLGELEKKLKLPASIERFIRITEIAPDSNYAKEAEYYIKHAA